VCIARQIQDNEKLRRAKMPCVKKVGRIFFGFLLLVLGGAFLWRARAPRESGWQTIAPGVEMRALSVQSGSTLGGASQIIALRTAPQRVKIRQGSLLEAGKWREKHNAIAVTNGGYFDPDNKSLGLRVCDGKKKGALHPANWGVFFISKSKSGVLRARILHTRDFKREYSRPGDSRLGGITQAVQCGPRLVVGGKTTDLKPQIARRTGIGIQSDGKIVLAVSDGALAFDDWARLWRSKNGLNCPDALNLDGGGSTQLSLKTNKKSLAVSGAWPVPDVVLIR
jgi:uncharacterized protein YigE (DUF2233 family)